MALQVADRLGRYHVTAKIGAGGMGEVYRARDTNLDRVVALKVLPEAFTSDPDRLARFEREAKVLASLNRPNIGHISGLEEAEGTKALVLGRRGLQRLNGRGATGPSDRLLPNGITTDRRTAVRLFGDDDGDVLVGRQAAITDEAAQHVGPGLAERGPDDPRVVLRKWRRHIPGSPR